MSGYLNKAQLIGNLGADPESRAMQNGGVVVTLSVATSESWRDQASGERRARTEWHRVVIFNEGLGRIVDQYLTKGAKVYVEGMLRTRKWQDTEGFGCMASTRRAIHSRRDAAGLRSGDRLSDHLPYGRRADPCEQNGKDG